jgi:hypothetical protein
MYCNEQQRDLALSRFIDRFGAIDFRCGPLCVTDFTDFYDAEMGTGIWKEYLTFKTLIDRDEISAIKLFTNSVETTLVKEDKRAVNLDPGYLTNDKLVLASTKDFYHRIYLAGGIFAEVTLHYRKGVFRFFSWTYPDYKDERVLALLTKARATLVKSLRDQTEKRLCDKPVA